MPGDALQRRRVGGLGARRVRVHEGVAGDQLAKIAVIGDMKVPEPRVLRIRTVALHPWQAAHRLGGNNRAHRLAGRIDQVQVMRLPAEVARRGPQHVVGEHRGELRAHRPKDPGHRRIHRTRAQVGAVELVYDAGQARELGT